MTISTSEHNSLRSHCTTWSHHWVAGKRNHRRPHPTIPQCVQSAWSKLRGGHAHAFGGKARFSDLQKSLVKDEINELRAQLEKLAARNTEAAQSTFTSPFSVEIRHAPLLVGFRMPTMATYEGKTDPLDHLDAFNDQMDLLQVTMLARCRCFAVTLSGTARK